jgi:hypothetical protein
VRRVGLEERKMRHERGEWSAESGGWGAKRKWKEAEEATLSVETQHPSPYVPCSVPYGLYTDVGRQIRQEDYASGPRESDVHEGICSRVSTTIH